jgi:plasmid maintenance system antidote protein VapI
LCLSITQAAFGGAATTWLEMQSAYDLAQARRHQAEITAGLRRLELLTINVEHMSETEPGR